MGDWLTTSANISQILGTLITVIAVLWTGWKWIVKPFKKHYEDIHTNFKELKNISVAVTTQIIPVIDSLNKQFPASGGKTIKDQLTRINDNLRMADLRNKLLSDNILSTGIYECDANGDCLWANKTLCDLFGLSLEEMLGAGWLSGIAADEREHVWNKWKKAIELDIPYETEYTVVNIKTREHIRVRTTAIVYRAEFDKKVLGYYGTIFIV